MKKKLIIILLSFVVLLFAQSFANQLWIMELHFSKGVSIEFGGEDNLFSSDFTQQWIWELFQASDVFIKQELKPLLSNKVSRDQNFTSYLWYGTKLANALEREQGTLDQEYSTLSRENSNCQQQLNGLNSNLEKSLKNNDARLFVSTVEAAREARVCLAELKVLMSANRNLYIKSERYLHVVILKNDYLSKNKNLILNHYELLEPKLLKELYTIAQTLENWEGTNF